MFEVILSDCRKFKFRFETFRLEDKCRMSHVVNCYIARGDDDRYRYAASAFCSESDTFNAEAGYVTSLERAIITMANLNDDDIFEVWRSYFQWLKAEQRKAERRELLEQKRLLGKQYCDALVVCLALKDRWFAVSRKLRQL